MLSHSDQLNKVPGFRKAALERAGFSGERGTVVTFDDGDTATVVVGLGPSSAAGTELRDALRRGAAAFARSVSRHKRVAFELEGSTVLADERCGVSIDAAARAVTEGLVLGAYRFDDLRSADKVKAGLGAVTLVVGDDNDSVRAARAGVSAGAAVAAAVTFARDLVNTPGGTLTAPEFADRAASRATDAGLTAEVLDLAAIKEERLGGLVAVNQGSTIEPRLVKLTYVPEGADDDTATVALVGKGITFDSGGLSLKPAASMMDMKDDMGGAAAVIGAMTALPALGVDVRVVSFTPMTLGNLVWKDLNDNGKRDTSPALEPAVANVTVELFRDNGNNTFDPPNDPLVDSKTTNSNGNYQFTNLPPGNYFVRLPASNFTSGGALFGCSSSSVTASDPNTDVDNDDNGLNTSNPPAAGVASGLVILVGNSEPDTQVDGDGLFGNQTVDFGFVTGSLQLGNLVWKDTNGNGLREATELPVANVLLELFRDSNGNQSLQPGTDTQVATTTTDANGKYLFANLTPGDYFVRVASSNFVGTGPLAGCVSTLGSQTANNDRDNDDNGSDSLNPAANPPASSVITLTQNGEPDTAVDGDDRNGNQTIDFGFYNPLTVSITDPATCVGPGSVLQITAEMINLGAATQPNNPGPEFVATLPPTLAAVTGSCSVQGGNGTCTIVNASRVEWNGSYAPGERVVISYSVQLVNNIQAGEQFCLTSTANFDADLNGSNEAAMPVTICDKVTCQPVGPGIPTDNGCSVLIYPVYTSSPTNPNSSNTRINLTNTNPNKGTPVHLFFVDGASCSVTDAYVCLTANQTTTFLVSDLDPGTTGYVVAVAVDDNGCPASFNWLLGDEYVKFESGHFGNLTADCATRLPGAPQSCQVGANSTELRFDGASYSLLPRVVAVSNIPDRASGNDTLLTLHRLSGNLATGMDKLNSLFGILYDDAENGYSFNFNPNSCQFRSSLSNNFPRTAPRFEQVIPGGRSGWMKLWSFDDAAIFGASINFNPDAAISQSGFTHGHNLHKLRLTAAGILTIPIFPPNC